LVAASINADPIVTVVNDEEKYDFDTIENCDWEAVPVYECDDDGDHICDICDDELQETPSLYDFDAMERFSKMCMLDSEEESACMNIEIKCCKCEKVLDDGLEFSSTDCEYCYSCGYELFYEEPVSIVPTDAKLIDEYTFCSDTFDSYEHAKHALKFAVKHRVTQELSDSYVVAYYRFKKCRWWFVLERDSFKLSLYADKDEIRIKYLMRQMEEIPYIMEMYEEGDSDNESDAGDPDFCQSCAPSSAPFCCFTHMTCFENGNGLKWCGDVEKEHKCGCCESVYYRSQRHEEGYGRVASQSSEKGIRPIDSAICMFDELGLNDLLFYNIVDLCEYFN
jgi:hypothetical protein